MRKSIYISHGDKGGCGKSMLAMTIASILSINKEHFLLVEADSNLNGGQPDVSPRFEDDRFAEVVMAPISGQESAQDLITDLFDIIEQTDVKHVVINTPAGASEQLEQVGSLVGLACANLGYRLVVFYNIFKTEVAVRQAQSVLKGKLAEYANEFYLVKSDFFGAPSSHLISSLPSLTMPILHKNVMDSLGDRKNLAEALETFPILRKIQVEFFLKTLSDQGLNSVIFES